MNDRVMNLMLGDRTEVKRKLCWENSRGKTTKVKQRREYKDGRTVRKRAGYKDKRRGEKCTTNSEGGQ